MELDTINFIELVLIKLSSSVCIHNMLSGTKYGEVMAISIFEKSV